MTDSAAEPPVPADQPPPPAAALPAAAAGRRERPPRRPAQPEQQRQPGQPARGQRAPSAPHPVLEQLFALYPGLFGARFVPLKLGVYQELLALHPQDFKKEDLKVALGLHARSTRYLEAVASGAPRHDLQGAVVEPVAPEHVHHAVMEVFRRRQARSKEDLRPWLRGQLVRAIEASGLSREAYTERVPTPDAQAAAALDDAFAQLAETAAKNEALRRAFAASGQPVEQFADMYGLDARAVGRLLAG